MNTIGNITFSNAYTDGTNKTKTATKELGKDQFLNLLITQLQHQNPLEPMEDSAYVAQLAQFSQLEQLENMSKSLDTSTQVNYLMSQTIANTMATSIIGKTVIADGSNLTLTPGQNAKLSYNLAADASDVTIKILNSEGAVVRTVDLENKTSGNNSYTWDGKDDSGSSLGAGEYTYEVTATNQSGEQVTTANRVIGMVDAVKYIDGKAYLMVDGYKVDLSTIIEVDNGNNSNYQSNG
jgi:flagellar basal-body rod modification protein FlgD